MKQLYMLKTKRRGMFLVLLLMTTLPMVAQGAVEKFEAGGLVYKVLDATKQTISVEPQTDFSKYDPADRDKHPAYDLSLIHI